RAFADRGDFARGFGADGQRQLALCEGHAAIAPDIDVVESHRLDADLHLAGRGRGGWGRLHNLQLTVGDKGQRAHETGFRGFADGGWMGCVSPLWAVASTVGRFPAAVEAGGQAGSRVRISVAFWPPK